jgi:hypothetical protein
MRHRTTAIDRLPAVAFADAASAVCRMRITCARRSASIVTGARSFTTSVASRSGSFGDDAVPGIAIPVQECLTNFLPTGRGSHRYRVVSTTVVSTSLGSSKASTASTWQPAGLPRHPPGWRAPTPSC